MLNFEALSRKVRIVVTSSKYQNKDNFMHQRGPYLLLDISYSFLVRIQNLSHSFYFHFVIMLNFEDLYLDKFLS